MKSVTAGERKGALIKDNVAGDDDTFRGEVETAISFVRGRIAEKNTGRRAWSKFVGSSGGHVGIAKTAEDTEVAILGRGAMEQLVGDGVMDGRGRASVQEIGGCGKHLGPILGWHVHMEQECADCIV